MYYGSKDGNEDIHNILEAKNNNYLSSTNIMAIPETIKPRSKPRIEEFSTTFSSTSEYKSYQELLLSKKDMLSKSISSSRNYLSKKYYNITEEIDLLAKEIDVINRNIWNFNANNSIPQNQTNEYLGISTRNQ